MKGINSSPEDQLTIGQCASLACLLEASAPKPGNVHRGADFAELSFDDFLISAAAIAPAMDAAVEQGVGATIHESIRQTRRLVGDNTNLGMVLLIAPLAAVPRTSGLQEGIGEVLAGLTSRDSRLVYEAIRLAEPGGLGDVAEMDVQGPPPEDLLLAMQDARDRDIVARQYVTRFEDLFEVAMPHLVAGCLTGMPLSAAIIRTHVYLMSRFPDTLIARKCGDSVSQQAAGRAAEVVDHFDDEETCLRLMADLDFWLRSDGQRRNPGATADLISATLFAAFRENLISPKMMKS